MEDISLYTWLQSGFVLWKISYICFIWSLLSVARLFAVTPLSNYNWSSIAKSSSGININPSFRFCHYSLGINAKTFNGFRQWMKALYVMQQDVESRWVLNNYNFMLAEIQRFLYSLKTSLFIWIRQCVLISLRKGMNLNKQGKKMLQGRKSLIAYGNSAVLFLQSIFLLLCFAFPASLLMPQVCCNFSCTDAS